MSWSPLDRSAPHEFIKEAIRLFKERKGKVIVEIGCIRQRFSHSLDTEPIDCPSRLDGHSTALFAETGARFYTCDIDPKAIGLAKEYVGELHNVTILQKDGLKFLKTFGQKIDLLALDAFDVDQPGSAQNHLRCYQIAKRRLHKDSIVWIDDTDVDFINGKLQPSPKGEYGGKGRLLVPLMIKEGWKVHRSGRCTILIK